MIQQEIERQNNLVKKMDISFWIDIDRQKKYIKTKLSNEDIKNEEEFEKIVADIMENNNVPLYMKPSIIEEIKNIEKINELENSKSKEDSIENNIQSLIDAFKNSTIKYNKSSYQPVFPKAYNSLINSKTTYISDILLTMERNYTKQIEKIWKTKEKTEVDMKTSYNQKVEARNGNLTNLMTSHYEEMELVKATFDSQIEEMKNNQKKEYHFFIENLYNELKTKEEDSITSEEIQEIIIKVINKFKEYSNKNKINISSVINDLMNSIKTKINVKQKEMKNIVMSPQTDSALSSPLELIPPKESEKEKLNSPVSKENENNKNEEKEKEKEKEKENPNVKELLDMGFTNEQALAALELSKNNLEQSIFYLLEKPFVVEEHIRKTKEKKNELKNKSSINSMLNWAEKEKLMTNSASESFLPISKSLSNLNLKSTSLMGMKKLGSFFGSIKDLSQSSNLNNEIKQFEESNTADDELSETFTIYHGTQVRIMYNIRIMVQNFENIFEIPKNNEQQMAYFAQTASSLYSDNINGVIVLLTPSDWPKYAMGESANKTLIQQCKRTTEFHFDDIEKQLCTIEKTLPKDDNGNPILNEGDFFVTCHSNLPLIHVIFHLVVNDAHNATTELYSRSKCINGYKNILSYAHKYDINNLTIPLLILPKDQISNLIEKSKKQKGNSFKDSVLNQYIEVLLKNTKVYMIESSRMIKHSLDSSGTERNSRTLQFILPKIIDSNSFHNIVDKVSKIFRTT